MIYLLVASTLLFQATVEAAPAAMVLEVKGKVEVEPVKGMVKFLTVMDLLYPGDKLRPNAGAQAMLVFMVDGHQERVQTKAPVTVSRNGCTPPDNVTPLKKSTPEKKLVLEGLKETAES